MSETWSLGVDVGGTFTDLVAVDPRGGYHSTKTPSTADQSLGVMNGIERIARTQGWSLEELLEKTGVIVHGTTVATNALLEYRGAKLGLITTKGFRDELEFRRSYKESTFNPRLEAPPAICPRRYRIGVPERVDARGEVIRELDESAVRAALAFFREEGIESVAVAFLFSFLNPAHERRVAELVAEVLPDAFLSLSCEVLPEIREFERVSTTVVNAFTGPAIRSYLDELGQRLESAGFGGELFIMQSNGGVLSAAESARLAVGTLLSGPAGGVTAASFIGDKAGYGNLITVDMGGTSYDISVIEDLEPTTTTESWIGRYRIALPMLDIHTIGAGGGSIAWIDDGGALRVGPQSAGAEPGPACYGRGGARPTVTDVNLLLGYLDPDNFLGGEMKLDVEAARNALDEHVAAPLELDTLEAAAAVSDIVNNNMANASHFVTTKRGYDPKDFALVAVGGAGAVHAGRQAELLGVGTVIVPGFAPVFCALGDIVANLQVSEARTLSGRLDELDLERLNEIFSEMEKSARERMGAQQVVESFELRRQLDLRYVGEVHEVTVPLKSRTRRITALNLEATASAFHELHDKLYSHRDLEQPIEVLTLRLELVGLRPAPRMPGRDFGPEDPAAALTGERTVHFDGGPRDTPVYDGGKLEPGNFITGPALIEQWGTTIVVHPSQEALVDAYGNVVIELGRG